MITPVGCSVAAESLAGIFRQTGGSRTDIKDADFENISRLGVANEHRARAYVHAKPLAILAIARAASDDGFSLPGPMEDAFRSGIALDHPFGVVIGMMGQNFNRRIIARSRFRSSG